MKHLFAFRLRSLWTVLILVVLLAIGMIHIRSIFSVPRQSLLSAGKFTQVEQPIWNLLLFGVNEPQFAVRYEGGPSFSSAHLKMFPSSTRLRELILRGASISDSDMPEIAKFDKIEMLWLISIPMSDRGIVYLKTMSHVSDLNLTGTKISDAAMRDIGQMTQLTWLGIADTEVSDAGIIQLRSLAGLQDLYVGVTFLGGKKPTSTQCTSQGFAELRKTLPSLKVY